MTDLLQCLMWRPLKNLLKLNSRRLHHYLIYYQLFTGIF